MKVVKVTLLAAAAAGLVSTGAWAYSNLRTINVASSGQVTERAELKCNDGRKVGLYLDNYRKQWCIAHNECEPSLDAMAKRACNER